MVSKKYLEDKISEVQNRHPYMEYLTNTLNEETACIWKEEQERKEQKWHAIQNNEDVIVLIDRFDNIVSSVEKSDQWFEEDGFDMALAFHDALQGLCKMAEFIEPDPQNDTDFELLSEEEADDVFERLDEIAARMDEVNRQRAMREK